MTDKTKSRLILLVIMLVFIVLCIVIVKWIKHLATNIKHNVEVRQEEKRIEQEQERLNWILDEINELYLLNEEYTNKRNELETQQTELHNSAESNRKEIDRLWNEYYKDTVDGKVMDKICELSPNSPMCNDYVMLNKLMWIADERGVDYKLLLWIMYAESHIWANFNQENCRQTNNWWWVKNRKYDDGTVSEKFDKQYQTLDKDLNWCRLYYFDDVEQFFESLANTIGLWYAKCNEDPYCIMKYYVWHESGAWVRNVYLFKSL